MVQLMHWEIDQTKLAGLCAEAGRSIWVGGTEWTRIDDVTFTGQRRPPVSAFIWRQEVLEMPA
jgi:hypothetical protein